MSQTAGNVHREYRAFFHPVAWSDEVVAGSMFATTLLDEPLVAWRDAGGRPVVFHDECPHRGAPLTMGRLDACEVVCGFHGWHFDANTGAGTAIPSMGPGPLPPRARLSAPAAIEERYGIVWVALDPPRLPVIEWADADDPALGRYRPTSHVAEIFAAYQTDNLLDASHFPFLHAVFSSRNPELGEYETVEDGELTFRTVARKLDADGVSTEGWLRYSFAAPFMVLLRSEEPGGELRTSFFQAIQPIDARRTRLFFSVRIPQTDPADVAATLAIEEEVQLEDLAMNAALRRTGLPLDGELHVRTDRNGVLYRRIMRRLLDPSSTGSP